MFWQESGSLSAVCAAEYCKAVCGGIEKGMRESAEEKSIQVYEGIYDIVAGNLQTAGQSFAYQKTTFLRDVENPPRIVDVSKYVHLANTEFFQAVYVAAYKRLPETNEAAAWEDKYDMTAAEFQKAALQSIVNSSVAAINHIQFINNPYFEQNRGIRYKLLGVLYGLTDKSSLRQFGKKMPQPIQKIIRKVFL